MEKETHKQPDPLRIIPSNELDLRSVSQEVGFIRRHTVNGMTTLPFNGLTTTTDATVTTIFQYPLDGDNITYFVEAYVLGRRTGGSAGTAGDSAGYIRRGTYQRAAGAAPALVGAVQDGYTAESQAGWDCTLDLSTNDLRVRVTGAANNTVVWHTTVHIRSYP